MKEENGEEGKRSSGLLLRDGDGREEKGK